MSRVLPGGSGIVPTVSSLSTPPSTEASHLPPVPSSNLGTPDPGSTSWLHSTPPDHAAIHPAMRRPCDRTNNQATHPGSPLSSKNPATTAAKLTIHALSSASSVASAPQMVLHYTRQGSQSILSPNSNRTRCSAPLPSAVHHFAVLHIQLRPTYGHSRHAPCSVPPTRAPSRATPAYHTAAPGAEATPPTYPGQTPRPLPTLRRWAPM